MTDVVVGLRRCRALSGVRGKVGLGPRTVVDSVRLLGSGYDPSIRNLLPIAIREYELDASRWISFPRAYLPLPTY